MLRNLVKIANRLDSLGLSKEADVIDGLIQKMATSDNEDFNRRNDAFYEKMRDSGTPMPAMGEHRPYMHELYPSSYKPRKPTTQEEFNALLGPADEYGDTMRRDILNQRGIEPEEFSERLHGESYEIDVNKILDDIDADRELEERYPAAKKDSYYDKYDTEEFDKEASRRMRGMRKRS